MNARTGMYYIFIAEPGGSQTPNRLAVIDTVARQLVNVFNYTGFNFFGATVIMD